MVGVFCYMVGSISIELHGGSVGLHGRVSGYMLGCWVT